jgi:hypothetical protein
MENISEFMRQARAFLAQHRDFIPLHHVEDVLMHGNVETYVMAGGTDINTEQGNRILCWEFALYLICLELCNLGLGNRPYQPHPYMHDPVIVEPEQEVVAEVPAQDREEQPVDPIQDPLDIGQLPPEGGDGVRVDGPFLWPNSLQPPMVLIPSDDLVVNHPEPPKPKVELKSESKEYIEPYE